MKKYKLHIIWGIVVVIALIGGVFWGKSMVSSAASRTGAFAGAASGTRGAFAGRTGLGADAAGGGFVAGQVTSVDSNSLTLQLANGNSENVFFSSSTSVVIRQTTSVSAIQSGAMVMIGGTQNSDGSLTATTIQVRGANTTGGTGTSGGADGGAGTRASQ